MAKSRFNTPKELLDAYKAGLPGATHDPRDVDKLMGELPHPLFGAAADASGISGSGEGKVSLLYPAVLQFDPSSFTERQTTGDCVSHATRNAADCSRAVEIYLKHEAEGWEARGATEAIYGSRNHGGQGMSCSGAARFVNSGGGILLRKNYGFVDFSTYDSRTGTRWGRSGIPEDVKAEGRKHQVKTISLVSTVEEARDAIANGYAISVCSGYGFSSKRDEDGFARKSGSWSHAMAWTACDDSYKRPGFLIQNSWGKFNSGPKRHDQPDGSFWIDYDIAAGMLRGRGSYAMSNVDGFPPQKLPDWGAHFG